MKKIIFVTITVMLLSISLVAADYTLSPSNNGEECWSGGGYMNTNTFDHDENTGDVSKNYTYGGCENDYYSHSPDAFGSATGLKMRFLIDYKMPSGGATYEEPGYINVGCADTLLFGINERSFIEPKPIIITNQDLNKQWYEFDITNECLEQVKTNNGWLIGFEWQGGKYTNELSQGIFTVYEHELLVLEENGESRTVSTPPSAPSTPSVTSSGSGSGGSSIGSGRYYINEEGKMVNGNEEQAQKEEISAPTPTKERSTFQKINDFDAKTWIKSLGPKIKGWLIK